MNTNDDFTVSSPQSENPKLENLQLLETGPNPCILYSIIQLGKHFSEYQGKKSDYPSDYIHLIFEFPLLKQLFRANDTEKRPTVLSLTEKFMIVEKSNLTKIVSGMLGRALNVDDFKNGVNLTQFLGKTFIVDIENKTSKNGKVYSNIVKTSFKPATPRNKSVYVFEWDKIIQTNENFTFSMKDYSKALTSKEFTFIPPWIREKIMDSEECKSFIADGGKVAEKKDFADKPVPFGQSAPTSQTKPSLDSFIDIDDLDDFNS